MDGRNFILTNVGHVPDKEDYLKEYISFELELEDDVECVTHVDIPDRVIVTFNSKVDLIDLKSKLSEAPLEDKILEVEPVTKSDNTIIISGVDLSHQSNWTEVSQYFQREFFGEEKVVSTYIQIPSSKSFAVFFNSTKVIRKVLNSPMKFSVAVSDGILEVQAAPLYLNFHGCVLIDNKLLRDVIEEKGKLEEANKTAVKNTKTKKLSVSTEIGNDNLQQAGDGKHATIECSRKKRPKSKSKFKGKKKLEAAGNAVTCERSQEDPMNSPSEDYFHSEKSAQSQKLPLLSQAGKETKGRAERKTTCRFPLEYAKWELLKGKFETENHNLSFDESEQELTVQTTERDEFFKSFDMFNSQLTHRRLEVDQVMQAVLASKEATEILDTNRSILQWTVVDDYLHLYSFDESYLEKSYSKLEDLKFQFQKQAKTNQDLTLDQEDADWSYDDCNRLVHIFSDSQEVIITRCFTKIVRKLNSSEFVGENDSTKSFSIVAPSHRVRYSSEFSKAYYNYLINHHQQELENALKHVQFTKDLAQEKIILKLHGSRVEVENAKRLMRKLNTSIKTELLTCLDSFKEIE